MPETQLIGAYQFAKTTVRQMMSGGQSLSIAQHPLFEILVRDADARFSVRSLTTINQNTNQPDALGWAEVLCYLDESGSSVLSQHGAPERLPGSFRVLFTLPLYLCGQPISTSYGVHACTGLVPAPDRVLGLLPQEPPAATASTGIQLLGVYRPVDTTESTISAADWRALSSGESPSADALPVRVISRVLVETLVTDPDNMFNPVHFGQVWNSHSHWLLGFAWRLTYLSADGAHVLSEWEPPHPLPREFRLAFYMHYWLPDKPFHTSYGSIQPSEPAPMPARLSDLVPYEESSPYFCDPTVRPFEEWLRFFFEQPVAPLGADMLDHFSMELEVRCTRADVMVEYMTRLFTEFGTIARRYSLPQVNQGIWALLSPANDLYLCLWDPFVPLERRVACIRAMVHPFADFMAGHPAEVMENCFHMWWDLLANGPSWGADPPEPGADPDQEDGPILTAMFETLCAILKLDDQRCQGAALHGLGHLYHSQAPHVLQAFIDAHRAELTPPQLMWLEQCRDRSVM